jgi:SAM-dependent methyltransferase
VNDAALTSYDHVPYPSVSHIDMHPSTIAAVAAICGHTGTKRSGYRVLEIGCGSGANLLSMALAAPDSEFTGIDLAPSAVEIGNATARAAGLANARFAACNILDPGVPPGPFDYIIAHGVYAWVPGIVRERIMSLCGEALAPNGIATLSYNVFPGCRIREALRDMLLDATAGVTDPKEKLQRARAFLTYQIGGWNEGDPYCAALKMEAVAALKRDPEVLYHDELGECFEPQMLGDVVASARANGLDYLGDSHISLMAEALFPGPRVDSAHAWSGGDWVRFEQLLDFTGMRRFRRSMLVRAGKAGERRFNPARLAGLYADAELTRDPPNPEKPGTVTFRTPREEEIGTTNPEVAALLQSMADAYPQALDLSPYATGKELTEPFAEVLFSGALTLRTRPLACVTTPGERPLASPLARAQATLGEFKVASIKGGAARLGDEGVKAFLLLLDGTRTRAQIAQAMAAKMNVSYDDAMARTPAVLAHLAKLGVMQA